MALTIRAGYRGEGTCTIFPLPHFGAGAKVEIVMVLP
jgi:hypothetical protein